MFSRVLPVHCRLILLAVLPVLAPPSSSLGGDPPSLAFELKTKWTVTLSGNPIAFSFGVCADGTLYATGQRGLDIIGSDGKLVQSDSTLQPAVLGMPIACDRAKNLVVAGHELSVFSVSDQGKLIKLSSAPLAAGVRRLLAVPDGTIYGIAEDGSLIAITTAGDETLMKRDNRPRVAVPIAGAGYSTIDMEAECGLTWDPNSQRLAYMLPGMGIAFQQGQPKPSRDHFKAVHPGLLLCGLFSYDNLASLANGQFAEAYLFRSEIADKFDEEELQILDSSLKPIAQPVTVRTMGHLIGSSSDGSLYFASFEDARKTGVSIVKRSAVSADSQPPN